MLMLPRYAAPRCRHDADAAAILLPPCLGRDAFFRFDAAGEQQTPLCRILLPARFIAVAMPCLCFLRCRCFFAFSLQRCCYADC